MVWIKRNLFFVISAVVALAATGYCAYLLFSTLNKNSAIVEDYNQKLNNYTQLQSQNPYPSKENIQLAKEDQEHVRTFLADFRKEFAPFPTPPAKDEPGFKRYLEDALVQFRAGATNAGVQLPENYAFGFSGLLGHFNYPPANIAPWMQEIEEIGAILDVLYKARINYLALMQRVPVSPDDVGPDCLQASTVSNVWGSVTPYRVVFRGFSTEIAAVLEGFARSSNCFIVKSITVAPDTTVQINQTPTYAPPTGGVIPPRSAPIMPQHFDRGIPGVRPAPAPVAVVPSVALPVAAGPPVTILAERPLSVTLSIDVVKLKATEH
jgi:hypothetical protein